MKNTSPKVFISYSSMDKEFVYKLNDELKKCQVETWIDKDKLEPGENWINAIFNDGLVTSNIVLIYITENALNSKWVDDEVSLAISLKNEGKIQLLPFVDSSKTRNHPSFQHILRTLQVIELNQSNIDKLLPTIVSKIWRIHYKNSQFNSIQSGEKVDYQDIIQNIERARNSIRLVSTNLHTLSQVTYQELIVDKLVEGVNFDLVMSDFETLNDELIFHEISKFGTGNIKRPKMEFENTIENFRLIQEKILPKNAKGKLTLKLTTLPFTSRFYSFDSKTAYILPYFTGSSGVNCPYFKVTNLKTITKFDNLFSILWGKAREYNWENEE